MIDPKHLLEYIIRPVLKDLYLWSVPAEQLILGTACQESECGLWLRQVGGGPALGIYQMEPATHDDIWDNYLEQTQGVRGVIREWYAHRVGQWSFRNNPTDMIGSLPYATAMCRIYYLRIHEVIPDYLAGQAAYWKKYYNTEKGAGTAQDYIKSWNRFIKPDVFV